QPVPALGEDGQGVNGLSVKLDGVKTAPCGAGCYGAFVPLGRTATVTVNGDRLTFAIPAHPTPAPALVTRATRRFRALRSVEYVERLASSPRDKVVSDFALESPNKLEYRIRGGASGIIIGSPPSDPAPGPPRMQSGEAPA